MIRTGRKPGFEVEIIRNHGLRHFPRILPESGRDRPKLRSTDALQNTVRLTVCGTGLRARLVALTGRETRPTNPVNFPGSLFEQMNRSLPFRPGGTRPASKVRATVRQNSPIRACRPEPLQPAQFLIDTDFTSPLYFNLTSSAGSRSLHFAAATTGFTGTVRSTVMFRRKFGSLVTLRLKPGLRHQSGNLVMTTISKVLAVFVSVASIAFMAFALAQRTGGPNWEAEAREDDLQAAYMFQKIEGETTSWDVTRRFDDGQGDDTLPRAVMLPLAVMKAREDLLASQNKRISDIQEELQRVSARKVILETTIQDDLDALKATQEKLVTVAQGLDKQIEAASKQLTSLSEESEEIRQEARKRGEDVIRLRNQLAEIETDIFRLGQLRTKLTDRLVRIKITNRSLSQRNRSLSRPQGVTR